MSEQKRTVKFADRCGSWHAGSSTCAGCDPKCWLDDDPYARTPQPTKSDDYADLFKGTNFGTTDYRKLIREGLEKVAMGYYNGHTLEQILLEAGFVERRKDNYRVLTQLGLDQLTDIAHRDQAVQELVDSVKLFVRRCEDAYIPCPTLVKAIAKFESRGSNEK